LEFPIVTAPTPARVASFKPYEQVCFIERRTIDPVETLDESACTRKKFKLVDLVTLYPFEFLY